jgi:hypothetical protein
MRAAAHQGPADGRTSLQQSLLSHYQSHGREAPPLHSRLPVRRNRCAAMSPGSLEDLLRTLNSQMDHWNDERTTRGTTSRLHEFGRLQSRQLLHRDGRCDNCMRWNDVHGHQFFDDCEF